MDTAGAKVEFRDPQCDILFELFAGPRGRSHVGRMLKGADAGRLVTLREVPGDSLAELAASVDVARSIAHPKLVKVLGIVPCAGRHYLSSEYVPGASLFELGPALRAQQTQISAPAAVRIAIDALSAASAANTLLRKTANVRPLRLLQADTIWVAEFGETLLTEVGIALSAPRRSASADDSSEPTDAQDILTLGAELFQLLSGRLMTGDVIASLEVALPAQLAEALRRAIVPDANTSFGSARAFAEALALLPPALVGTEQQVSAEVRRIMQGVFAARRRKLEMLERDSMQQDAQEATRFFRASGLQAAPTRDTARPPAPAEVELRAETLPAQPEIERDLESPVSAVAEVSASVAPHDAADRSHVDGEWQNAPTRIERSVDRRRAREAAPELESESPATTEADSPAVSPPQPESSSSNRPSAARQPDSLRLWLTLILATLGCVEIAWRLGWLRALH